MNNLFIPIGKVRLFKFPMSSFTRTIPIDCYMFSYVFYFSGYCWFGDEKHHCYFFFCDIWIWFNGVYDFTLSLRQYFQRRILGFILGFINYFIWFSYPSFHLTMHCYLCNIISGEIELHEHKSARWLTAEMLNSIEWLPADKDVVKKLKSYHLQS